MSGIICRDVTDDEDALVDRLRVCAETTLSSEGFRDDDGTRVLGLGNLDAKGWSPPLGTPGFSGSFTALTPRLNWKPKSNIFDRPETRCDWYDGSTNPNGLLPFDVGNSSSRLTFATDPIIIF